MNYENQQPAKKKALLKNFRLLLMGSITAVSLLAALEIWRSGDQFFAALGNLLRPSQPAPKVNVQSVVLQQVRNASELTTAIFNLQAIVPTSQDAAIGGWVVGTTKLLYIAYGEVRAGVDLSTLTAENIQVDGDQIRIQLPSPRVLSSKIDVNRSTVYDYNRGFLGLGPDAAPQLQSAAQQQALKTIVETACTNGLLQQANDRAKLVVTQLLSVGGYQDVTIEVKPPTAQSCSVL